MTYLEDVVPDMIGNKVVGAVSVVPDHWQAEAGWPGVVFRLARAGGQEVKSSSPGQGQGACGVFAGANSVPAGKGVFGSI